MGEAAAEAGGYLREVERKVGQRPPVPGAVPKEQWFHGGDRLASIYRFDVRFHGRHLIIYKYMLIRYIDDMQGSIIAANMS